LSLFLLVPYPNTNVISTEAAHSFIVSSAVERSLYFAVAVACPLQAPKINVILSEVAHGTL
jgi:hypothetical protein